MPKRDAPFGEIVRRELKSYFVTGENAYAIPAKPAGKMGEYHSLMFELDAEETTRELFQDDSGYFYAVLFAHTPPDFLILDGPAVGRPVRRMGITPSLRWSPAGPLDPW